MQVLARDPPKLEEGIEQQLLQELRCVLTCAVWVPAAAAAMVHFAAAVMVCPPGGSMLDGVPAPGSYPSFRFQCVPHCHSMSQHCCGLVIPGCCSLAHTLNQSELCVGCVGGPFLTH